jgi:hypothetical protein
MSFTQIIEGDDDDATLLLVFIESSSMNSGNSIYFIFDGGKYEFYNDSNEYFIVRYLWSRKKVTHHRSKQFSVTELRGMINELTIQDVHEM